MSIKSFTLSLLLFAQINIFAQNAGLIPGFYISEKGDTLRGYFEISELSKNYVGFSKTNTSNLKLEKLYPCDVQKIVGQNDLCILPKTIEIGGEKEFIFIDQLTFSEIHLFRGSSNLMGDVFYLNTFDHSELTKIPKNAMKPFFESYFLGCPGFGTIIYSQPSLINAVAFFQKCRYKSEIKTNKTRSKIQFSYGINTHVLYGQSRLAKGAFFEPDIKMMPGVFLRAKMGSKASLQSGLIFSQTKFEAYFYSRTIPNNSGVFLLTYNYLHVPLFLHFEQKPHKKVSAFCSVGPLLNKAISAKTSNGLNILNAKEEKVPQLSGSFFLGAGCRIKTKNGQSVEISANYMWEVLSYYRYEIDTNYWGLNAAYVFSSDKRI